MTDWNDPDELVRMSQQFDQRKAAQDEEFRTMPLWEFLRGGSGAMWHLQTVRVWRYGPAICALKLLTETPEHQEVMRVVEGRVRDDWSAVGGEREHRRFLSGLTQPHLNGYAAFRCPVLRDPGSPLYDYVPVHGGITFRQDLAGPWTVYGWDTAHAWDIKGDEESRQRVVNRDWASHETEMMVVGLVAAREFEDAYLAAEEPLDRAMVLDAYGQWLEQSGGGGLDIAHNTAAILRLLSGRL